MILCLFNMSRIISAVFPENYMTHVIKCTSVHSIAREHIRKLIEMG